MRNLRTGCVLYQCVLGVWLTSALTGSVHAQVTTGDPAVRVARLTQVAAEVSLEPAGTTAWTQAEPNTPLTTGDRLYVNRQGHAELQIGELAVRAWKFTDVGFVNLDDHATQLAIAQGSLHVRTFASVANKPVEVDTPNGAVTVTQPGDFRLDVYTNAGGTLVTVDAGAVQISGPGILKTVGAGQSVHLVGSNPVQMLVQRMPGKDPFDAWSRQLDGKFLRSDTRRYVNPATVGSQDLDAYGKWSETLEFGPVWYPSDLPAGWSPYSNGRWSWIAPWGWTWVDADPWGFAPFHYGRWTNLGSRWGWVPGPKALAPVYAPAMVAFLGGPTFSGEASQPLAGWFPLSPAEPFYPAYACSRACFTQVNLSNLRESQSNPRHIPASSYFGYYHSRAGFRSIRSAYRNSAAIAVPAAQFAAGAGVTSATVVPLTRQQRASARIVSHPLVAPTMQSVVPHPVNSVSVPAGRPTLLVVSNSGATTTAGGTFFLIARTAPPAPGPGFQLQLPALCQNAGRPLDPVQWKNLASGHAAGPATLPDFPPQSVSSKNATGRSGRSKPRVKG